MTEKRRSVEIQARTREEATELALEQLGAKIDDVTIEVLAQIEDDYYGDGEVLLRVSLKGAGSQGGDRGNQRERATRGVRPSAPPPAAPQAQAVSDEQLVELENQAKDIVRQLLGYMSIDAEVVAVDNPSVMPLSSGDPPTVFIDINGQDLGLLIGRRGENRAQLQYIVNLLMNKGVDDWVRVILDIEGYLVRREESLIGLAERVARQVSRNGRPIALEPMPPNERRIVHMTLQNHEGVRTESSGEGDDRRVTVFPA